VPASSFLAEQAKGSSMNSLKKTLGALAERMDSLSRKLGVVVGVLLVLMVLSLSFEVVMRYVFNMPTIWALDISVYIFIFIVYLGASYTELQQGHVKVDLLILRLPDKTKNVLRFVTGFLGLVFCAFFISGSWRQAIKVFEGNTHAGTTLNAPLFPMYFIIPIGIFFLSLQMIVSMFRPRKPVLEDMEGVAEGMGISPDGMGILPDGP
jgi:TRAP-type C4-dicarboxylate transport system permease small subunit